jgi:hypothetical protein
MEDFIMNYYIWDKQTRLLGIPANIILETRPDFRNDDVIVIYDEEESIITVESKTYFKKLYDISSDDVDIVALAAIHEMRKESTKTIKEALKELDDERDPDSSLKAYMDIIRELEEEARREEEYDAYIEAKADRYDDPNVKVISLEDIAAKVKKIIVVLEHVFIAEDRGNLLKLKCLDKYNNTLNELKMKLSKAELEGDEQAVSMINKEITFLSDEIKDECDATIKIDATAIYDYGDNIIIQCENNLNMIIDTSIVDSFRENCIEYERRDEDNEKYKVHYKTVNITLNGWYNELNERGNTVFLTNIE